MEEKNGNLSMERDGRKGKQPWQGREALDMWPTTSLAGRHAAAAGGEAN